MDQKEQERLTHVLKTTSYILDILRDDIQKNGKTNEKRNRAMVEMLNLHIYSELGIDTSIFLGDIGYRILDDIKYTYEKRRQAIKDDGLKPLEEAMYQLDFNKQENQKYIIDFIHDKYGISVSYDIVCPSKEKHEIIDYISDFI